VPHPGPGQGGRPGPGQPYRGPDGYAASGLGAPGLPQLPGPPHPHAPAPPAPARGGGPALLTWAFILLTIAAVIVGVIVVRKAVMRAQPTAPEPTGLGVSGAPPVRLASARIPLVVTDGDGLRVLPGPVGDRSHPTPGRALESEAVVTCGPM
jgi:hypothetical protein